MPRSAPRRRFVLAAAFVLLLAAPAGAAPPSGRLFVPGESLGGARLGMTKAQILATWGARHGVCRGCPQTTWYFNERQFRPQGTGVRFVRGRAVHLFTLWKPSGWRTPEGLSLGANAAEITMTYGALARRPCAAYEALVAPAPRAQSVFYVDEDVLWGFGLTKRGSSPCL